MSRIRSNHSKPLVGVIKTSASATKECSDDERARQLADIAASGDEDNAECAAADLARHITAPNNCPSKLPLVQSPTPKVPSKFSPNL